ncbi:hypothetical protein EJB05_24209, partial [Eragrostis curvula]
MEPKTEERQRSIPALAASAAAISMVLGDYDLVTDILLRLAPSGCLDLVRAAAVCRLWLRVASDPAFLRRFRDLLPRRLIGFYLTAFSESRKCRVIEFVPMQPPQHPEVAAVLRRGCFVLDGYDVRQSTRVMDCRDGRVVVFRGGEFTLGVHSPLHPARGFDLFPRLPMRKANRSRRIFQEILSKEIGGDGLSYICVTMDYCWKEQAATVCVYMLQDDAWHMHSSASTQIHEFRYSALRRTSIFLAGDRIFMRITKGNVLVLDLASSTFFTIDFHAEKALVGELRLAPGDDSGVYLVHVKDIELSIWLHRAGNGGMGNWVLLHTIYLRDMCSNLRMPMGRGRTPVYIHGVGDNAEFVFLEMCGCVLYLDVKTRELQKVYEVTETDTFVAWIHPFVTKLTPTFPALKEQRPWKQRCAAMAR